jgi:uncharacterized RDD family membrane protein YckC
VGGTPYAGLVSRASALAVDILVLTLGGLALTTLPTVAWQHLVGDLPDWLARLSTALGASLPFVYFTGCWWLGGHTVGGMIIGTSVRRANGKELSLLQAAVRALVGLLLAPVWLIGLLGILTDGRRRAWHDRIFRTVVCYSRSVAQ